MILQGLPARLTATELETYRRYARLALPRHTSYPMAPAWREDYLPAHYAADLANRRGRGPISLYVHVPYCRQLCYYCACTKEIISLQRRQVADPVPGFLAGVAAEMCRLVSTMGTPAIQQLHWGGGSPTFLDAPALHQLWKILATHGNFHADAELAVEIDPRITTFEQLQLLREIGFNRISLGIQDFSARVQEAVNRRQPIEIVKQAVAWCRQLGFPSINFDLIYGLPFQTTSSMDETITETIRLQPDRIAFYRLAMIPEMFRWQNVFQPTDLPAGDVPLEMNLLAINRFQEAGYEFIGLDHFAKPAEGLAQALRDGTLHRNFQGMTTGKALEIIALGPSAITQLDDVFAQNAKESGAWEAAVTKDFATCRGLRLSADDRRRRELLQQLYGHGTICPGELERQFGIDFAEYFRSEREHLKILIAEGIVAEDAAGYRLTFPLGRLLARVVAAVFDAYLPPDAYRTGLPQGQSSAVG